MPLAKGSSPRRGAFARAGYDGVGVREISKGAGVTAMLVNRYFGSKERLFAEVAAETITTPSILTRENLASPNPGQDLAAALVEQTKAGATPLHGFLITLHSAVQQARRKNRPDADREAPSKSGDRRFARRPRAPERAALVLSRHPPASR